MKRLNPFIILITLLIISTVGCKKEQTAVIETNVEPVNEQQVRQTIQKALEEIQKIHNVDFSIQTRMAAQFIVVPAGSNNALAQALIDAGEGGIVYLRSGMHTETAGITIRSKVTLIGENGAILRIKSVANMPDPTTGVTQINPAIHVLNAPQTNIQNIEFQPMDNNVSTAILYENSPLSSSMYNTFKRFMLSIVVEKSNQMTIMGNKISASTLWQESPSPIVGILIVNGKSAWIANNEVENAFVGIFMSDQYGSTVQNNAHNNYWGIVLCHLTPNSLKLPDGRLTGAALSANNWKVRANQANNNINIGYLVIDGANNNILEGNRGNDNGTYDVELAGQTARLGFPMPPSFNNQVTASSGQKVKNCGNNNILTGGNLSSDGCADAYPNDIAVEWLKLQNRLFITTAGFGNVPVNRVFGYIGVTMYEALLPSLTNYKSLAQQIGLTGLPTAQSGAAYHGAASVNAAMAQAMRNFFSATSAANKASIDSLEAAWAAKFSSQTNAAGLQRSVDFGKQVANVIFEWSKTDGTFTVNPPYVPPVGPGLWEPTPPAFGAAIAPYIGKNRTFIANLVNNALVIPPAIAYSTDPNSDFYKMVKEVYTISQNLTPEEANIAKTWADVPGSYNSATHYINLATQLVANYHLSLEETAVLIAKSSIAVADAIVYLFKLKYQYNLVRPITYIRSVLGQPNWNAAIPTPAHPEYPSAHAMIGQALIEVLKARFGNNISLIDRTNENLYGARTFNTLDAIAQETAWSRVLGGIHYKNTVDASLIMGADVGRLVNNLQFKN